MRQTTPIMDFNPTKQNDKDLLLRLFRDVLFTFSLRFSPIVWRLCFLDSRSGFSHCVLNVDVTVTFLYAHIAVVAMVFEATRHIIKLYQHRRRKNKKRTWRDTDYTQRNDRTRFLYYACVSGWKVPFTTSVWSDPKDRKGNGQKYYLTVNTTVTDP